MKSDWMEKLANQTFNEAWIATLKDIKNLLRKNKIIRIYDLHL